MTVSLLQLSKQKYDTVVGLITEHADVNYHKHKTGRDSKFCGTTVEITRHILREGEALLNIRRRLLQTDFIGERIPEIYSNFAGR